MVDCETAKSGANPDGLCVLPEGPAMFKRVQLGDDCGIGVVLECPGCGGEYLHQGKVTAFNRGEDAKETRVTSVDHAGFSDHILPSDDVANPSIRRYGLSLEFTCETCHEPGLNDEPPRFETPLELTIAQHKGCTHLQWRLAKG